ncbi:M3 family metallopeptidase [Biformimicrobium ophioploci]|uniref:M3 family metallopeptidase n=1 Tax=Biformimicrobium ophioploci TaxID=3036711 RepID=A0ABQ6M010_9GAMM|nr:M3 family metallopeptidase [Microbulbifer sp. NKW57]GMG87662.1 M3 family metallopeptidase [Microbulbifer sp. NKW57]
MDFRPAAICLSMAIALSACDNPQDQQKEKQESGMTPASQSEVASVAAIKQAPDLDFSAMTAEQIKANCERDEKALRASLSALESFDMAAGDEAFLKAYNQLSIEGTNAYMPVSTIESTATDAATRDVASECGKKMVEVNNDLLASRPIYEKFESIATEDLPADTRLLVEKVIKGYLLAGIDKSEEVRAQLKTLSDEIYEIGVEFDKNIREDVRSVELDPSLLKGMPEDYVAAHPAGDNGKVTITTAYPDIFPFLRFADDDAARREIYKAFMTRAYPQNKIVLEKLMAKRHEKAQLLGFSSHAELVLADKMAADPETVSGFLDDIAGHVRKGAAEEYEVLLSKLQSIDPAAKAVGGWQSGYLSEKIRQDKYALDAKEVRQYFQYGNVRDGILGLITDLFEVEIQPWETAVWHDSVQPYEMRKDGEVIGRFYLDMHPRDGKYQHAAMFPMQTGVAGKQVPIASLLCNFPGEGDDAALMDQGQVLTFLHEFGHLVHWLFGGHQQWADLSGIATEWDFVEAPSQMLEEWFWDKETLQGFAVNAAGESLPDALFEKMVAARDFGMASGTARQLGFATMSLDLYSGDPATIDVDEVSVNSRKKFSAIAPMPEDRFYANFGHLNGYSAIYYTYQWSKAIAADLFTRFEREGLRDEETAADYRNLVLGMGGAKPAAELIKDFLGRDYSFEAYVNRLNPEQALAENQESTQ